MNKFEKVSAENSRERLPLRERLDQRDKHLRVGLTSEPSVGEITPDELSSYDPECGADGDYASAAMVIAIGRDGFYDREKFIKEVSGGDYDASYEDEADAETGTPKKPEEIKANLARARTTVEKMIEDGLLEERNGRVYSNIEFHR